MKVVVIGGGPAGMMAAITASKNGNEVYLLEKNDRLGKKLLITGKGRCNITSSLDIKDFIQNVPGNGRFLYSAFDNYTNLDIINFLKEHGVSVKEERGNRIFPTSDKSLDVLKAFEAELKNKRVKIKFNTRVVGIETKENKVVSVMYEDENDGQKKILADKVILATGGKTYSATGSTGDGYEIAQKLGHTIVPVKPSLVPLTAEGGSLNICKQMQGLSLRNVQIKLIDTNKNKKIYEDFGEMLFTHFGVSGPTILSSSAHLLRYKNVENLLKEGKIQIALGVDKAWGNEEHLIFSDDPYFVGTSQIVVPDTEKRLDPSDFRTVEKMRIGISGNEGYIHFIKEWGKRYNLNLHLVSFPDDRTLRIALKEHKVDAAIFDKMPRNGY